MVTSIMLNETEIDLKVGETYQFKVTHYPSEAISPNYEWRISEDYSNVDNKVFYHGEIDQTGLYKAIVEGTDYVTVYTKNLVDQATGKPLAHTCKVKINPVEVESLKMDRTEIALMDGDTARLFCSLSPDNATYRNLQWTTSNRNIVNIVNYVDNYCIMQAVGIGEAIVKAHSWGNTNIAHCIVKVSPGPIKELQMDEEAFTMEKGLTKQLRVKYTPKIVRDSSLIWSSSDKAVASVDEYGVVTAISNGTTIITATAVDGGCKTNCEVTVLDKEDMVQVSYSLDHMLIFDDYFMTAEVTFVIENLTSSTIKWLEMKIYDSNNENHVYMTVDNSLLGGIIEPGQKHKIEGVPLMGIYKPIFVWTYELDGNIYERRKKYSIDDLK